MLYRLLSDKQGLFPQAVNNMLPSFSYGHAANIGYRFINRSIWQNDFLIWKMMLLAPVNVCRIAKSSAHYRSGSLFHRNRLVR